MFGDVFSFPHAPKFQRCRWERLEGRDEEGVMGKRGSRGMERGEQGVRGERQWREEWRDEGGVVGKGRE